MSDFDATPIDEQASDLLDENATTADPAVVERLRQFASLRAAIADVEPPAPAVRERLIAAAVSAAPVSNVVPLRRRPFLLAGGGLIAAAAAASLIFLVANRGHDNTQFATLGSPLTTVAARTEVKAADSAATAAATAGDLAAATTAAATGTPVAPTPSTMAAALLDRSYDSSEQLVAAYKSVRDFSPPAPATTITTKCAFDGDALGPITYQGVQAELFVTTDTYGIAHLTALAASDCHRLIEVTVP